MFRFAPTRWNLIGGLIAMCLALPACRGKAPKIPTISVANGRVNAPSEVAHGEPFVVSGQFDDLGGDIPVNFSVYVTLKKESADGRKLIGANANIPVVKASKSTRLYEGKVDAPIQPGEWHMEVFAVKELIGECPLMVK